MQKQSRKTSAILLLLLLCFAGASPAHADDQDISYGLRIPYRIVRGAVNVCLGWTEIFLRPFGESKTEGIGEAMATGAANTLIRLGVGVVDITTFWVPDIQMLDMYPDWQGWPYLFHWS